jgi:hypothetical protein
MRFTLLNASLSVGHSREGGNPSIRPREGPKNQDEAFRWMSQMPRSEAVAAVTLPPRK